MLPLRRIIPVILTLLLLTGCEEDTRTIYDPGDTGDSTQVAFQDQVAPYPSYLGTRDAAIKEPPSLKTHNFGNAPFDTIGMVEGKEKFHQRRLILRMDLTYISSCSMVTDAFLHLSVAGGGEGNPLFAIYRATVPGGILPGSWTEGSGRPHEGVSWIYAGDAVQWNDPGGDYYSALMDTTTAGADSTITFSIPGAVISHWINYPHDNHGFLIVPAYTGSSAYRIIHLREWADPEDRPRLEFTYLEGG